MQSLAAQWLEACRAASVRCLHARELFGKGGGSASAVAGADARGHSGGVRLRWEWEEWGGARQPGLLREGRLEGRLS